MTPPTIEDAKALIERMKTTRPTCHCCAALAYDDVYEKTRRPDYLSASAELQAAGWEEDPLHAALFLRCNTCRNTFSYPWAAQLDAESVLDFMLNEKYVFEVSKLESLL